MLNVNQNPKAIANLILDVGNSLGRRPSNLSINKVAYFAHGYYLAKYGKPLIDAKIEAWEYGPVFREIYHEFKKCGDKPVNFFARDFNPESEEIEVVKWELPPDEEQFLREVIASYLDMSAGYLVRLSHLADGPWDKAWNHEGRVNPGMEISNDDILRYFSEQVRH
jgi:uncharacterized phage-associated protein